MMDAPPHGLQSVPIGPVQRALATAICAVLLLGAALLTPHANRPLMPVPGYLAAFAAAMVVTNLLLASLLYIRGHSEQDVATVRLGSAYLFVAAIFPPLLASFPDTLLPGSLIGTSESAVWLWVFWHGGFGLGVLRYGRAVRRRPSPPPHTGREALAVLALVGLLTIVSIVGIGRLPQVLVDESNYFPGTSVLIPWTLLLIDTVALLSVARLQAADPEPLWLTVGMVAACVDIWLTLHGSNRYSLGWYVSKLGSLFTTMVVLLSFIQTLSALYQRTSGANRLLARLAHQDGLTGLANRRRFDEVLEAEWRRARRHGQPLSLLMLDVDLFKRYNDHYGHLAGDECLQKVAEALQHCVHRPADLAARYGGEEFAIILPETPHAGALEQAHRIRERLAELGLEHRDSPSGRLTLSIGAATLPPDDDTPERLVQAADTALYRAKADGRDRVCCEETSPRTTAQAG